MPETKPRSFSYNIHFKPNFYAKVRARADEEGITVAALIRQALEHYLRRRPLKAPNS